MHLLFSFLQIYPRTLSISSGESATIYVWVTVPVACKYDSSYPCKLVVEMVDFNEQFTSGSPKYCNESITALTKPSLCGLELNGWNTPWTWQSLTINLPENTAQDQEYIAKLNLRIRTSTEDPIWSNYLLPEISVSIKSYICILCFIINKGRCGRDCMVVRFIATYVIECLSPLTLRVWIPLMERCTWYNIM